VRPAPGPVGRDAMSHNHQPGIRLRAEGESNIFQATFGFVVDADGTLATFFDEKELFGHDVTAKFPTLRFNIVEAGNCYARGRGMTAKRS
jgi:hypothetical protein